MDKWLVNIFFKTWRFSYNIFVTKLRKYMENIKIDDFHGKFYRYIGRLWKLLEVNGKMKWRHFVIKTDDFHVINWRKIGAIHRKYDKLKIFLENTDTLGDIWRLLEMNGKKNWRCFLIKLTNFKWHICDKIKDIHGKNVKIEDFHEKFYRYIGRHMKT